MWEVEWKQLLKQVLNSGSLVKRRKPKRSFQEIISYRFTIGNPRDRLISDPTRAINIFQCIGHFLWITQGNFNLAGIKYYQPFAEKFSSDRVRMIGAYGPRLFGIHHLNQMQHVITTLHNEPLKRRAVASVYLPQFDQHEQVDEVPCTLNLQYLIRNKKLHAVTYMRSQDAYAILPYDIFLFTMLQEYVTAFLQIAHDIQLGEYHHFSGSFHIYTDSINQIKDVIQRKSINKHIMKKMPSSDIELRLGDLNKFETVLRNTITSHEEKKKDVDFDFFFSILRDDFSEEYWYQLALILLCYGTIIMKDSTNMKKSFKMLDPLYQYYVQMYLKKHRIEI